MTPDRIKQIEERLERATPGPWTACCKDKPKGCAHVCFKDGPICEVTKGKWGDEWPAIRVEPGIGGKAEAYMEMFVYGEISEEISQANKILIASAPSDLRYLLSRVRAAERVAEAAKDVERITPACQGRCECDKNTPIGNLRDALTAYDAVESQP